MARIPDGAGLVENAVSKAPGFRIGNVIVMAGVPTIMQAMLDDASQGCSGGAHDAVETIEAGGLPEGAYGEALGEIAGAARGVSIGSYPSFSDGQVPQPDRRARQGCAAVAEAAQRSRGDDREPRRAS